MKIQEAKRIMTLIREGKETWPVKLSHMEILRGPYSRRTIIPLVDRMGLPTVKIQGVLVVCVTLVLFSFFNLVEAAGVWISNVKYQVDSIVIPFKDTQDITNVRLLCTANITKYVPNVHGTYND
ncbi:hypothetical protein JG687_00010055 [Phytophthora cactorum]|uniref:Uncharacterized protein n=1 Tax=Phytophthora cactorum TaxID=29920 RepID=A0A8T1UB27_9STRA|nr:hypothetical protein JG687_00010055 [Phytophthora cactorum]